jgi:hypothetical protein
VDAAGEVPQFGQGVLGAAVSRADEHQRAVVARVQGFEVLLDLPQGHGQRGQPDLGPVVQVALEPAQPRGRGVDRAGPPLLEFAGALGDGEAVLERDVVGAPVGRGVAQHPGGQQHDAEPAVR